MEEKYELRDFFLREFIKELILNTPVKEISEETVETPAQTQIHAQLKPRMLATPMPHTPIKPLMKENFTRSIMQKPQEQNISFETQTSTQEQNIQVQPIHSIKQVIQPVSQRQVYPHTNLATIERILRDSSVLAIECVGAGRPIRVNRSGRIQDTKLVLNADEIKNAIEEFSTLARIPLVGKIFKAAVGNIVMTAVFSDYIGTRFILEKKRPVPIAPKRFY